MLADSGWWLGLPKEIPEICGNDCIVCCGEPDRSVESLNLADVMRSKTLSEFLVVGGSRCIYSSHAEIGEGGTRIL